MPRKLEKTSKPGERIPKSEEYPVRNPHGYPKQQPSTGRPWDSEKKSGRELEGEIIKDPPPKKPKK